MIRDLVDELGVAGADYDPQVFAINLGLLFEPKIGDVSGSSRAIFYYLQSSLNFKLSKFIYGDVRGVLKCHQSFFPASAVLPELHRRRFQLWGPISA